MDSADRAGDWGQIVDIFLESAPPERVAQPAEAIARVEHHFAIHALEIDRTDGISMAFPQWRFNLRSSNTEPVVRLNVESRGDQALMESKRDDLLELIRAAG